MITARRIPILLAAASLLAACGVQQKTPRVDGGAVDLTISFGIGPDLFDDGDMIRRCDDWRCRQVECGEGITTSIKGTVYIPNGTLPLYNVIVYVPNRPEEIEPFKPGVVCDACGAVASGKPLVVGLTNEKGQFQIDDAPAGDDVPLVIQVGRWRRQFTIPHVEPCSTTQIPDKTLRMPSKRSQGDIPKIALATGSADPFECLLVKIGLDPSEFTAPNAAGRINLYKENGLDTNPAAPPGSMLYSSLQTLKKYDVVMLPCEGLPRTKNQQALQNLLDYTSSGGRVFATHYSYTWLANGPDPFPRTGDWKPDQSTPNPDPFHGLIDMSFPKGQAFAKWLLNVGASLALGKIDIKDPRHDINAAYKPPSQRWIYGDNKTNSTQDVMLHMTFNTPIVLNPPDLAGIPMDGGVPDGGYGPLQCGRVVYSDFHVSTDAVDRAKQFVPDACKVGDLTAQEKALTFMLFDLSACVMPDEAPPETPIP